jgi:uracil phosphoribosyltransferase
MSNLNRLDHPLIAHHLAELRDQATAPYRFRAAVQRLTYLMVGEATRDLATAPLTVRTPMAQAPCSRLSERIAIVPILRAGLGMVDPLLEMLPQAEVWHLGVYRNEQTLEPVEYYRKLPRINPPQVAMVIDPMLATGGSVAWAIEAVKAWQVPRIKLLSLIASPQGVQYLLERHADVQVYVCAVDARLDDRGYIVPGLGDAGDRVFNTLGALESPAAREPL